MEIKYEEMCTIKKIAKPLVDYLISNYNPYTEIVVTSEIIKVKQDVAGVPTQGGMDESCPNEIVQSQEKMNQ